MSDDQLPVEQFYTLRQNQQDERDWRALLSGGTLDVGTPQQNLESGAAAAEQVSPPRKITPPIESASESVRARVQEVQAQGPVRQGIDKLLRTFTGASLEDVERAVQTGELSEKLSLRLMDPAGALMEQMVLGASAEQGMAPELAQKIGSGAGLLAGMLFSPPGGKGAKGAKALATKARPAGVNTERMGGEEGVKGVVKAVNEMLAERMAGARKTVTHGQTIEEGQALGMTLEQAASIDVEKYDIRAVQQALRDYHNAAAKHLKETAERVLQGDQQAAQTIYHALALDMELAVRDELLGKVAARGLEARKIFSEADRAPFSTAEVARLGEVMQAAGSAVDPQVLARRILAMTPSERKTFAEQAAAGVKVGLSDFIYEAWINALLSGPQTHAANMLSNSLTAAYAPIERELAAMLDLGRDRSVFHGEAVAMLYGMVEGARDGFRLIGRSIRDGKAPELFGGDKALERIPAISADRLGRDPDSAIGSAVDYLGMIVRAPGMALRFEDSFFKAVNYRMELRALAWREASQLGLEGKDRAATIRKILADPASYPEAKARAEQFALTQTFNRELDELGRVGAFARGIQAAADAVPMGRVVVPFVRTPTNIFHFSMERTPVLNALSDTLRADIMAGGERRALAFGKVAGGMLMAGTVAQLSVAGRITGGGPKDPALKRQLRDTGWQPYSIKIGEAWYSYNRLDPIGATLGIVADYTEIAGQIPEGRKAELALAAGLAISKSMTSKTYLEGIANVFEAIESPERGLDKYLRSLERTLVPTGVRQIARTQDPTLRETRAMTEVQELINEVAAGVPGWSASLPPRRNLWGEPVVLSGGWGPDIISPIYSSVVKDDPVARELVRHKIGLSLPQPVLAGVPPKGELRFAEERPTEGVRLTPEQYDRLAVLTGQGIPGEIPLREALGQEMQGTAYQEATDGPDGGKAVLIRGIVTAYKKLAVQQLREEYPDLDAAIESQITKRINARDPDVNPPDPSKLIPGLRR